MKSMIYNNQSQRAFNLLVTLERLGVLSFSSQVTYQQDLVGKCDIMVIYERN